MEPPDLVSILRNHHLTRELQDATSDVKYTRSIIEVADQERAGNFTIGLLGSRTGFAVKPAVAYSLAKRTVVAVFYLGRGFTGHKGYAHGGLIATVLDECCGRAAVCHYEALKSKGIDMAPGASNITWSAAAITTQLQVNYLAVVPTDACVIVKALVRDAGASGRKASVSAQLWSLSGSKPDKLSASAESHFLGAKI